MLRLVAGRLEGLRVGVLVLLMPLEQELVSYFQLVNLFDFDWIEGSLLHPGDEFFFLGQRPLAIVEVGAPIVVKGLLAVEHGLRLHCNLNSIITPSIITSPNR